MALLAAMEGHVLGMAMAALVTHRLNGSWNSFWASRPADQPTPPASGIVPRFAGCTQDWLYAQDEKALARWVRGCIDHLCDASGIGLQRHLDRSRARRKGKDALALDDLSDYLRPRLAITDYVDYKAKGLAIGSGMIESTCKQVVGQRMKGPGMQWSEQGALAMAALVTHRLNGSWNSFWASRPLQRAA